MFSLFSQAIFRCVLQEYELVVSLALRMKRQTSLSERTYHLLANKPQNKEANREINSVP